MQHLCRQIAWQTHSVLTKYELTVLHYMSVLTHSNALCRYTMLVVRGLCSFASIVLLYTSLQLMPLSDSVVLQFLSPIMVALAAPLILKELPSRHAHHLRHCT